MSLTRITSIVNKNSSIVDKLQELYKSNLFLETKILSNETVSLTARTLQINNLIINGNVIVRSNTANTNAVLEVLGDLTLSAGSTLDLYKVLLIVHGNVIGDSSNLPVITTPNGANGGFATVIVNSVFTSQNGSDAISEGGGGSSGTNGTGPQAGAGGGAGLGGRRETGGFYSGGGGGGAGGGGGGGGVDFMGTTTCNGGNGGIGAGGGGGGATGGTSLPGTGGAGSELLWVGAGGNGGESAGGGGGSWWMKAIFLDNVSNVILRTGKGGVGGTSDYSANFGNGGQSGSMRVFLYKNKLSNVTFDVTKGNSTNSIRDGANGDIYLQDMSEGQFSYYTSRSTSITSSSLAWSYTLTNDSRGKVIELLSDSQYTLKGYRII